jgi:hypothetical protein
MVSHSPPDIIELTDEIQHYFLNRHTRFFIIYKTNLQFTTRETFLNLV